MQTALIIADACLLAAIIVGGIYLSHFQGKFKELADAHINFLQDVLEESKEKTPKELVKEVLDMRQLIGQTLSDKERTARENQELKKMADALKSEHEQQSAQIDQLVQAATVKGFRLGLTDALYGTGRIIAAIYREGIARRRFTMSDPRLIKTMEVMEDFGTRLEAPELRAEVLNRAKMISDCEEMIAAMAGMISEEKRLELLKDLNEILSQEKRLEYLKDLNDL
jgi:hypothetical protein